ncbi:MAG: FtsX-like permease family protein, partial [Candidatus Moraniibacteriota bacterium]
VRAGINELSLTASSISETIDQANKVFSAIQLILMIFGLIALIVSAIGMFNTMTIALLERTEEIGIMKAIGASKTSISLMFIMEATLMGFLGALGGVFLGYMNGEIINLLVNAIANRFGGESVDLFFSPLWFVLTVILFGAFVGLLTGIFPARAASKIDTLDALRYK